MKIALWILFYVLTSLWVIAGLGGIKESVKDGDGVWSVIATLLAIIGIAGLVCLITGVVGPR